jgi:alpha-amylase
MQKCQCIIGTYNHVPEGAEESSFEETYQVCWRPFLSSLYRFPDILAVLHYSGTALSWLEARHPEFLMLLEEMMTRKQIELLGGGFFAPLLPLVSGQDRLGQIEMLTTYIRKAFGRRPRGCWVQEYAWEPGLASSIQACGFDYTFLPERHFRIAGADLGMPAITEDQGRSLTVFPVFDATETTGRPVVFAEAISAIQSRKENIPLITVLFPGEVARELWEKSGLESPDLLFERSFAALQKESLVLETTTPGRYLKSARRLDRAYFSNGASLPLMQRSLARREAPRRGDAEPEEVHGSPRRLLIRQEESIGLYAKMQYVRILVGQLRGDKSRRKSAQEELWKGQCGDAYWNSLNGGILRLPVRSAAYAALIEAEKTTRQRGGFSPGVIMADIDFDGQKEILYQGSDFNAYVHQQGGTLFELDSLKTLTNYLATLAAFDGKESSAAGPESRRSFQDRFYKPGRFGSVYADCHDATYAIEESDRPAHLAILAHECSLDVGGRRKIVALRKKYSFRKVALSVIYELANREDEALSFRFGTELNFAAGSVPEAVIIDGRRDGAESLQLPCDASGKGESLLLVRVTNAKAEEHLDVSADTPFELVSTPLFRTTNIYGQEKRLYQGVSLLLGWDLTLAAGSTAKLQVNLEMRA